LKISYLEDIHFRRKLSKNIVVFPVCQETTNLFLILGALIFLTITITSIYVGKILLYKFKMADPRRRPFQILF